MSAQPQNAKRGKMSDLEMAEVDRLAVTLKNPTVGEVARRLNRLTGTIGWYMMNKGYLDRKMKYRGPRPYMRHGKKIWPYTKAHDDRITALRIEGKNPRQIAEIITREFKIPRNGHSIDVRLKMLAAFEIASESEAA